MSSTISEILADLCACTTTIDLIATTAGMASTEAVGASLFTTELALKAITKRLEAVAAGLDKLEQAGGVRS